MKNDIVDKIIGGGEKVANIKSSKKRIGITEKKTLENKMIKSSLKTKIKKFNNALTVGAEESQEFLKAAVKSLDVAASKGIIHKNAAARKKSRLTLKLNKLNNQSAEAAK